jgi:son of sevenless-like protein
LLTIVEAVMAHPDVPLQKVGSLQSAKEGLYNVTSSLAESVRQLTASQDSKTSEEEEKASLLRSATGALKAAADCVAAVKMCLNRSIGERAFIINLPITGEARPDTFVVRDFTTSPLWKSSSMANMHISRNAEVENLTGQSGQSTLRVARNAREPHGPRDGLPLPRSVETTPVDQEKILLPRIEADNKEQQSLLSPSDEGSSWEDAQRDLPPGVITPMEERLLHGDLAAASLESAPEPRPDPVSWMLSHDYPVSDVAYNSEGNLVGATIEVLVEKMTPHDTRVDSAFASVFFLTFRLFSSPMELVEAVISRYNLPAPQNVSPDAYHLWEQRKCIPVRLRVSNFLKTWLESHWRPLADNAVLPALMAFVRDTLAITLPAPSQRILELCQIRLTADPNVSPKGDRLRDLGMPTKPLPLPTSEIPRPTMTKTLLSTLRRKDFSSITITDFDALELARQMTIMECKLYYAIQPEEILNSGREGAKPPVNVKAVSTLSTTITGWVAESILNEPDLKKRQGLIKFFIKVADVSLPVSLNCTSDLTTFSGVQL